MTEEELKEIEYRVKSADFTDTRYHVEPGVTVSVDASWVKCIVEDLVKEVRRLQLRTRLMTACTTSQPILRTLDNWWRKR